VEQAITAKHYGFEPDERQQISVGFGSYDRMVEVLAAHCAAGDFVCGARFTMADVYVGSQVLWGLMFKTLPDLPAFAAYAARLVERPRLRAAKAIDDAMIAERTKG
jgi:glutathione S-transferase